MFKSDIDVAVIILMLDFVSFDSIWLKAGLIVVTFYVIRRLSSKQGKRDDC